MSTTEVMITPADALVKTQAGIADVSAQIAALHERQMMAQNAIDVGYAQCAKEEGALADMEARITRLKSDADTARASLVVIKGTPAEAATHKRLGGYEAEAGRLRAALAERRRAYEAQRERICQDELKLNAEIAAAEADSGELTRLLDALHAQERGYEHALGEEELARLEGEIAELERAITQSNELRDTAFINATQAQALLDEKKADARVRLARWPDLAQYAATHYPTAAKAAPAVPDAVVIILDGMLTFIDLIEKHGAAMPRQIGRFPVEQQLQITPGRLLVAFGRATQVQRASAFGVATGQTLEHNQVFREWRTEIQSMIDAYRRRDVW